MSPDEHLGIGPGLALRCPRLPASACPHKAGQGPHCPALMSGRATGQERNPRSTLKNRGKEEHGDNGNWNSKDQDELTPSEGTASTNLLPGFVSRDRLSYLKVEQGQICQRDLYGHQAL